MLATQPNNSPFILKPASVQSVMLRVLAALVPGIVAYVWFFGPAVLVQIALASVTALAAEAIALRLIQAIRADAEVVCTPDQVDLVSVTFDVAAAGAEPSNLTYKPRIDRKTRTILFTGGSAEGTKGTVMTATAVYRITPRA
jgi:hypothetical protein